MLVPVRKDLVSWSQTVRAALLQVFNKFQSVGLDRCHCLKCTYDFWK